MRFLVAVAGLAAFSTLPLLGCDETSGSIPYDPNRPVEKIACSGGAKCAECCNDGECVTGQECYVGNNEDGRFILFCDGPEDCSAPATCCIKQSPGGAIVASCSSVCNDGGLEVCQVPAHCDGANCGAYEPVPYLGVCDGAPE